MKKNLFGTDGIRTTVGTHPLTSSGLVKLGKAIGLWAMNKFGHNAHILIAHDTRQSCSWVKATLKSGLLTQPLILDDACVMPTPAVMQLIKTTQAYHCGIIVSASHNPYRDNGIKICDASGKISAADEQEITAFFYTPSLKNKYTSLGIDTIRLDLHDQYIQNVKQQFHPGFLLGKKIVLDCAHGATSFIAPLIFTELGANVIAINTSPDGKNINEQCGALHLGMLQKAVLEHQATIGFAFDGDGDRVMMVSAEGQVKNGDDMLALLAQHPLYATTNTLVGTVMTNQGLEALLHHQGKQLVRTAVGDKYIAEHLESHNLLLGGEQSGHIIVRDYLNTGDGIFAALRLLEVLETTGNWSMSTFEKYPQVLINLTVNQKKDLNESPLAEIIAESQQAVAPGRVLVRYSGTEPLLRIMTEAPDHTLAHENAQLLYEKLAHVLG